MNLSLWFSGTGNPTATTVDANDHYLDTNSGDVWMFSGVPSGTSSLWFSGNGSPAIVAKVDDYYLDVDTGDIWMFS